LPLAAASPLLGSLAHAEGTYRCDVDGATESGTFQLVGVHMGRCSVPR